MLPQRSELIHCYEEEIPCISTTNTTDNIEQHLIPLSDPSPIQINIQELVVIYGSQLSHSILHFHKPSQLRFSPVYSPDLVHQSANW